MNTIQTIRFVAKPIVFLVCLVPFALVVTDLYEITGSLGANPIENIQDRFGQWGLRFVMITLAVTPLRRLSGRNWLARFRRMLGLFAFFYILMHFLVWMILDQSLFASASALDAIAEDILERPFITIGMLALLVLVAMAATSTTGMRRRLGKTWQKIHNGVYVVGVLGVWHYWWQVKKDITEPLIYAAVLAILLGYRIWFARRSG